jgi:type I restriction enzyme S subunit
MTFKDSPIGRIPRDWGFRKMGTVTELMTNGFVGSASSHYRDQGVPYLMSKSVRDNKLDLIGVTHISMEFHKSNQRSCLKHGDLLTVQSGHIGTSATVPKSLGGANCHALIISRFQKDQVDSEFIAYYFNSFVGRNRLSSIFVGSTVPHINTKDLKVFQIPLPPLPEQQKITSILTSVDTVIEKTEAQINKLKDLKKAMMQELLTKGIGHAEFKDSPVGRIPLDWEVKKLSEVVDPIRPITYGIVQAGKHIVGGVPYIRVSDMKENTLSPDSMLRTSVEIAKNFNRSKVCEGDIVYALRGDIGKVLVVPKCVEGANLTQGTALISRSGIINVQFLLWLMRSPIVERQTNKLAKGSTFTEMTLGNLKDINIILPSSAEQLKVSSILSSIDNSINMHHEKFSHIKSLKKALMQDLLTGRVRVKV